MKKLNMWVFIFVLLLAACKNQEIEPDAWGNFETRETILSAQVGGRLLYLNLEKGQELEENILVGMIDTIQYSLNHQRLLAQRNAVLARNDDVNAGISVLQIQKANLEREVDRTQRLLQDGAATSQQLDDLKGKLNVIEAQISAARISGNNIHAELQVLDVQIAQALDQLRLCNISNPIQGYVLEKYIEPHELVLPGKALYKIADLSHMDLKVYVSGSQLSQLSIGQIVNVFIDADSKSLKSYEGTINWISSRAEFTPKTIQTREERVNQVYAVKIGVPNDGGIKIGMPGEVRF